ncbi:MULTISPECIES: ThiF family adenylyltransferase [unclassified Streptomyces]|uniref:ThiF family adenylyltransferase n=1 Tax=Streptomyces sp. TP-A0356 TaxID=1359208 RepID=UPI0006E333AD|nr:ThiF family adenylyltransferase [Streptomyces sp. TP-A0356]
MSPLTSRSPDLKRLQDEGFEVEVKDGHLIVTHVPYVARDRTVRFGILVSELTLAGDITQAPSTHVVYFSGDTPCDHKGQPLNQLINGPSDSVLAGVRTTFMFSSKPVGTGVYKDYYEKVTAYAAILSSPAQELDPEATARTYRVVPGEPQDCVFRYADTASSRAGIGTTTQRLASIENVAIVGLGGTGAYILDLVAKTPVARIHLFDGDRFLQHNAFRAPGAASAEELKGAPLKVDYYAALYGKMRYGIVPRPVFVDETSAEELREMDFVFLALDQGAAKRLLVEQLEEYGASFVDVGMGILEGDDTLTGLLRITTSVPGQRSHIHERQRIPFVDGDEHNAYARNIQIADLNALNAALAVVKWKKLCGFYADLEHEHHSVYQLDGNILTNEDTT